MESSVPPLHKQIRVLVVGAGLGTNAGLGVEVPLAFGAFVTDGDGGACEVSREERGKRYSEGREHFTCFMGEEFSYKWDHPCEKDYKGNAGFLVGALLKDPHLYVDVIQHPFNKADQAILMERAVANKEVPDELCDEGARTDAIMMSLKSEKDDMWRQGFSEAHAHSIASLLRKFAYDVVLVGSKGIKVFLKALEHAPQDRRISAVVVNGAECHLPEYTQRLETAVLPGQESESCVGHRLLHRLVLTSHGGLPADGLRKCVVGASAKLRKEVGPGQSVLMYCALDHRLVPNRESHSYPWSLMFPFECWFPGRGKPGRLVNPDGHPATSPEDLPVMNPPPLASLLHWAASSGFAVTDDGRSLLEQAVIQFPGPKRFAEIRMEVAHLASPHVSDESIFQPIQLKQLHSCPALMQLDVKRYPHSGIPPWDVTSSPSDAHDKGLVGEEFFVSDETPVFDVLFDAQINEMQIVLKNIQNGIQIPLHDILEREGQYATRMVRFFRYYDDKSSSILMSLQGKHSDTGGEAPAPVVKTMQYMLEELLAMNKNLGNFLWTGFMTPYTAYTPLKRFGTDLLEVVVKIEVARIGGSYIGFSRSCPNAEHTILGQSARLGTALGDFLAAQTVQLKAKRRREFMSTLDFDSNMSAQLFKFDRNEEIFFREHGRQDILGYNRVEFDIGGSLSLDEVYQELAQYPAKLGLASAEEYHFSKFGHSSSFRIFPDGKAWLAASCESQDFEFIQHVVAEGSSSESAVISLLTSHKRSRRSSTGQRNHWRIPGNLVPPGFFNRNGYEVFAYRKYGDAGKQFNAVPGAWEHFSGMESQDVVDKFWFASFGQATRKSNTFGQFDKFPAEICRGGTTAKLYCYDTGWKSRDDEIASIVLEGINVNIAAWWELQLYAMTARNFERVLQRRGMQEQFESYRCFTYSSEEERLQHLLRQHLESDLETLRNLFGAAPMQVDVPESVGPIPEIGSLARLPTELSNLLTAFLQEEAVGKLGIDVPKAQGELRCGGLDPATKEALFQELLRRATVQTHETNAVATSSRDGVLSSSTILFKDSATDLMSLGLRGFQEICRLFSEPVRNKAQGLKTQFLDGLRSHEDNAGSLQYTSRIAGAIKSDNVFTDLQEEVSTILDALESCS